MSPTKPEITVAAITESAGRFLVVEELINQRLVFNQPAGHLEQGESLLAAVIREVRDELKEGDQILVKVLAIEGNKIKLSRKAVLREQREKLKTK